ncbi:MAG: hypothetical protein AABX11_05290 [Nanoarchaeota archaeon]
MNKNEISSKREESDLEELAKGVIAGVGIVALVGVYLAVNIVNDAVQAAKWAYNTALGKPMKFVEFGSESNTIRDYKFERV